jgi:DNA-binding MarR family transcriptional regulator
VEQQKYYILKYSGAIYRQTQMYLSEKLRPYGVGAGQHTYLDAIARNPGLSLVELTQIAGVDACTTTRAVTKLEDLGYVRVQTDADDKRVRRVYVTEQAETVVAAIRQYRREWRERITAGMSEEEKRFTGDMLSRISEQARIALHALREGQE